MRRQSFRTSLDQVTKSRCNSHGKYDRDSGCPKDSWYSTIVTAGEKKTASRRDAIPPTSVETAATDLHRFDFDGMRHKHGGHLKHLESISLSCLHWEQDKLTRSQLLVMRSAIIHLAITRPACTICENCHMITLCWPYLHATIYNRTRVDPPGASPPVSWLGPCVGCLASRQQKKSTDLTWTNEAFPASQNKMLPFRSIRRRLQTKGLSGSISSNIRLRFWVLTVFFWEWSLLQQLQLSDWTEWDVNLSGLQSIKWLGHIPTAPANITEIMVSPKTLDLRLVTAGGRKTSQWNAILPKFVKKAPTDLHRFDLDWASLGAPCTQAKIYKQARYGCRATVVEN